FYRIASSSSTPTAPTEAQGKAFIANGTAVPNWSTVEPSYDGTSTNSLYVCELTAFTDDEVSWSPVSKSSAYEAAKQAYNKAVGAEKTATNYIEVTGDGIKVANAVDEAKSYALIDSSGMNVYQDVNDTPTSVASFGSSGARIGINSSGYGRILIDSSALKLLSKTVTGVYSQLQLASNGITVGYYDGSLISGQVINGQGFGTNLYSRKEVLSNSVLQYFVSAKLTDYGFVISHDRGTQPKSGQTNYVETSYLKDGELRVGNASNTGALQAFTYIGTGRFDEDSIIHSESLEGTTLLDVIYDATNDVANATLQGNLSVSSDITCNKITTSAIGGSVFSTESVDISVSASSTGAVAGTKSVTRAGYYPFGVVGLNVTTSGAYSRGAYLTNRAQGSCTLNVRLQASSSGAKSCTAYILWVKNQA
ncbi:MAG: hypothetical protein IJ526_00410, partial [Lachnospiraceae bacterium]|nr:hypothetical protein [Lachnospiraceae bacterium]